LKKRRGPTTGTNGRRKLPRENPPSNAQNQEKTVKRAAANQLSHGKKGDCAHWKKTRPGPVGGQSNGEKGE